MIDISFVIFRTWSVMLFIMFFLPNLNGKPFLVFHSGTKSTASNWWSYVIFNFGRDEEWQGHVQWFQLGQCVFVWCYALRTWWVHAQHFLLLHGGKCQYQWLISNSKSLIKHLSANVRAILFVKGQYVRFAKTKIRVQCTNKLNISLRCPCLHVTSLALRRLTILLLEECV